MVSKTNEQALESTIEKYLTGTCLEEIKSGIISEPSVSFNSSGGSNVTQNILLLINCKLQPTRPSK